MTSIGDPPTNLSPTARHFSFAFQPIVDAKARTTMAYEALIRNRSGDDDADGILAEIPSSLLPSFDAYCRSIAIATAVGLGIEADLNLNLLPETLVDAERVLDGTVHAAKDNDFDPHRIVLEITENVLLAESDQFADRMAEYRAIGIRLAMDDFGSGYSGLNLLANFQPDQLKLDHKLVNNIAGRKPQQAIARAVIQVCRDLNITLIAEGVEAVDEYHWFCDEGVHLFQGYLFARPAYEALPTPHFPG